MNNQTNELNFKIVTPIYTGGGIYCFYGKVNDVYFIASDQGDVRLVDVIPFDAVDGEMWYAEWQEEHLIRDIETNEEYKSFFLHMLDWIIKNKPEGNYLMEDMNDLLTFINKEY